MIIKQLNSIGVEKTTEINKPGESKYCSFANKLQTNKNIKSINMLMLVLVIKIRIICLSYFIWLTSNLQQLKHSVFLRNIQKSLQKYNNIVRQTANKSIHP